MTESMKDKNIGNDSSAQIEQRNFNSNLNENSKLSRSRLWVLTVLIIISALAWLCYWFFYLQYYESTDDAYANGNLININSVISGAVVAYYADNTDFVKEGQLLVELDQTKYRAIFQKELTKLASVVLKVKESNHGTALENHPLIEEQKENIRLAYYDLQHCSIYAPQTGYIAQRTVDVGRWIIPTTNLMAIIPINDVWVNANFKETQLSKIRIGQPATISFDLYGSEIKFKGKVVGINAGTGSIFSLIPPQNATGNWIKIVQRIPVRISLDQDKLKQFPIRLGISAFVKVDVSEQNLPVLPLVPDKQFVVKTNVFDIQMEKLNQILDKIILKRELQN